MIVKELHIEKYDWHVMFYLAVTGYHTDDILLSLEEIDCPAELMAKIEDNLLAQDMNSGFTYSNTTQRETVMVVGLFTSPDQFINSLTHELRHLVDDIGITFDMEMRGEEVAYLTGDTTGMLLKEIQEFVCNCKCHKH